jgi:ADP-ribose pyrophosphatase YjhB (NUDIX family)
LQRGIEPGYGKWVFPGGYVDRGETVPEAAVREAREEANLEVCLTSLLGVYSYEHSPVIIIVYVAEVTGGELKAADEAIDARLFAPEEIPWAELAFPSTFEALSQYVRELPRIVGGSPANLGSTKIQLQKRKGADPKLDRAKGTL